MLVYNIDASGRAVVSVSIDVTGGVHRVISIPLEEGFIAGSVVAYDSRGNPLPVIVSDGKAIVTVGNTSFIMVEYMARIISEVERGVYRGVIHPFAPSFVYLPKGAGLLGFNGSAVVRFHSERIVLEYAKPGVYVFEYTLALQPGEEGRRGLPMWLLVVIVVSAVGALTAFYLLRRSGRLPRRSVLAVSRAEEARPSPSPPPGRQASGPVAVSPSGVAARPVPQVQRARRDERDQMIIDLLAREGPMGVSEVARRLGLSKSTAWRKLQRLSEEGVIERIIVDGKPVYRVARGAGPDGGGEEGEG